MEKKVGKKKKAKKGTKRITKAEIEAKIVRENERQLRAILKTKRESKPKAPPDLSYRPRANSWLEKTLVYLQENGMSRAMDVRRNIGLDEHCKLTAPEYADRSNFTFLSNIIPKLINKGLVERVGFGIYQLVIPWLHKYDEYVFEKDTKCIFLTDFENIASLHAPVYAALVNHEKSLRCVSYVRGKLSMYAPSHQVVWERYYGEEMLRHIALVHEISFKPKE